MARNYCYMVEYGLLPVGNNVQECCSGIVDDGPLLVANSFYNCHICIVIVDEMLLVRTNIEDCSRGIYKLLPVGSNPSDSRIGIEDDDLLPVE